MIITETEAIRQSISHSVQAMGIFTQCSVKIVEIEIEFHENEIKKPFKNSHEHIVYSILMGDIVGESYLLMSDICLNKLSDKLFGIGNQISDLFKKEMLKELDNIVTAATISKLCNYTDSECSAYVPELLDTDFDGIFDYMSKSINTFVPCFFVDSIIELQDLNEQIEFKWVIKWAEND
ncbi:MAG: hypothetical protein SNJ77_01715 [Cytophagales bacterium]